MNKRVEKKKKKAPNRKPLKINLSFGDAIKKIVKKD